MPLILIVVTPAALVNEWENLVSGFQVQFHLTIFSSLIALTLVPTAAIFSAASCAGLLAAVFATASMGSGFIALAALFAGIFIHAVIRREFRVPVILLLLLCASGSLLAWHTRATFPALDAFHAHSVREWLAALWAYGAWPFPPTPWWFVLLWAPCCAVVIRIVVRRQASAYEMFLLCFGTWMLLQTIGLAWGRAGFASLVAARYAGMLQWSAVVSVGSLVALAQDVTGARVSRILRIAPPLTAALVAGFFVWRSREVYTPYFTAFVSQTREYEARLSRFMRTDDPAAFAEVEFPRIPYPNSARLVSLLRDPAIRDSLPAPLRRERFRTSDRVAFSNVQAGLLTHIARALLKAGPVIAVCGAIALASSLIHALFTDRKPQGMPFDSNRARSQIHSKRTEVERADEVTF